MTVRPDIGESAFAYEGESVTGLLRVVVSPGNGSLEPGSVPEGRRIRAGRRLGTVLTYEGPIVLRAPASGLIGTWLVRPNQRVWRGQPLVSIELATRRQGQPRFAPSPEPGQTVATSRSPGAGNAPARPGVA